MIFSVFVERVELLERRGATASSVGATMSLNPRCYALSQVSYLVNTINKKNYKSTCAEISSVRFLLRIFYLMLTNYEFY